MNTRNSLLKLSGKTKSTVLNELEFLNFWAHAEQGNNRYRALTDDERS